MAATPVARKRPAPDEARPAESSTKRARYEFENIYDYEMIEEIGEGTYGVVAKARDHRTRETVAVKWIRAGAGDDGAPNLPAVVREAGCLTACRGHPGIVQIKNVATDEETGDLYIVMELGGPSLRSRLTQPFSEDETRDSMRQLLRAAEKLHATGTIHRDINPDNILVASDGALKICGFGCATPVRPDARMYPKKHVGTLQYRSPEELIRTRCYGAEVDIWALGCVMAELLTGAPLFTATTEDDVLTQVVDLRDDLVTMELEAFDGMLELSLAGREVLAGLLNFESDERLTAADALKHRWFTQEDVELEAKPPAAVEYPGFVPLFSVA